MATTSKLGITLLESGAVQKEAVINTAFETIDEKVLGLGEKNETISGVVTRVAECKLAPTVAGSIANGVANGETVVQLFSAPDGNERYEARFGVETIGTTRGIVINGRRLNADGTIHSTQDVSFSIGTQLAVSPTSFAGGFIQFVANATPSLGRIAISSSGRVRITATTGLELTSNDNVGNAGQVLSTRGAGTSPVWANPSGYQGQLASNPATTGLSPGSTYFNTSNNKLHILGTDSVWRAVS